MSCAIEWKNDGVVWRLYGEITDDDLRAWDNPIYADPRFDKLHYQIVDYSQVSQMDMSQEQQQKLAVTLACIDITTAKSNPSVKTAIVSQRNDMEYYFGDCYKKSVPLAWQVERFENIEKAQAWAAIHQGEADS